MSFSTNVIIENHLFELKLDLHHKANVRVKALLGSFSLMNKRDGSCSWFCN